MSDINMCAALNTIYSRPEVVVEDRLSELLDRCIGELNDWEICGKKITEFLELLCFTMNGDNNERLIFENQYMKLFYCLNTKKAKLELNIREANAIKIFINIGRLKRLNDLSGRLKGKEYPFEIYKYGDKSRPVLTTRLMVDATTIIHDTVVIIRLIEI